MPSLTSQIAMRLDPVCMARAAGIEPDPWQAKVLRSPAPRIILNCSRQVGKSTTVALMACHMARYRPGSQILMLAPSQRQSMELFRTTREFWRRLDAPEVQEQADTLLRMELSNGSRILALPGKEGTVRGLAGIDLLLVDESARVPEELYIAIRPMLATSGGRLVLLSTPAGSRGWWYDVWMSGDGFQRFSIRAEECPRISKEFLAEERRALGYFFEQEYSCAFLENERSVFRSEEIERMISDEVEAWDIPSIHQLSSNMASR